MGFSAFTDLLHRQEKRSGEDWPGEVSITVPADPEAVFDVLADGWSYGLWVVGASHIRDVDPGWPGVGTRIHHSVGPWPLTLQDYTEVLGVERPRRLELRARSWPLGVARIRITLQPDADGTEIRMAECASEGPGLLLPDRVQYLLLAPRNREALQRLAAIVVGRNPGGSGGDASPEPGR